MKKRTNKYSEDCLTVEKLTKLEELYKLKAKAMLMEDRINFMGEECFEKTGRLCDPALCKLSNEYEDVCLDIEKLELLLEKYKDKEEDPQ